MKCMQLWSLILALVVTASAGCKRGQQESGEAAAVSPPRRAALSGRQVLLVLPPNNFRRDIFTSISTKLADAGAEIAVSSPKLGQLRGTKGGTVEATLLPEAVDVGDYAGVIFVGGPGITSYGDDPELIDLAKAFYNAEKVVGAIRFAILVLANADIIAGKSVACNEQVERRVQEAGGNIVADPVAVDGSLVTSGSPEAAGEFADRIIKLLSGVSPAPRN